MFSKYRAKLLYILLAAIGLFSMFSPTFLSGFSVIQPDPGDAMFNAAIMEHVYKALFDPAYLGTFYSPIFFYPIKFVLTFSDNLIGSAPIYWLLRLFFDRLLSFQLWEMIVLILSYFSYVYFLRFLKVPPFVSAVFAFVFIFGTPRAESMAHVQLFPQFYTPLFFVFLVKFLKNPTQKDLNLAMLMMYLQCLAGYYLGYFLILSVGIFALVYALLAKEELLRLNVFMKMHGKATIVSITLWVVAYFIFWVPYIYTSSFLKFKTDISLLLLNQATIQNYIALPPGGLYHSLLHLPLPIDNMFLEWGYGNFLFLGIFGVAVLGICLAYFNNKLVMDFNTKVGKSFFITGLALLALTFKFYKTSLWVHLAEIIPGADAIRMSNRSWVMGYFLIFTAAALMWKPVTKKLPKVLLVLCLVYFVAEHLMFHQKFYSKHDFNAISKAVSESVTSKPNCRAFYIKSGLKPDFDAQKYELIKTMAVMPASIDMNVPTLNGYSGMQPMYTMTPLSPTEALKLLPKDFKGTLCYLEFAGDKGSPKFSVSEYATSLK